MSYSWNGSTSKMLRTATVPLTGPACSFSAWIKSNNVTAAKTVVMIQGSAAANDYAKLGTGSASGAQAQHRTAANGNGTAASTPTVLTTGVWIPIAGVLINGSSRAAYAYGSNKGTDATVVGAYGTTPSELSVGLRAGGTPEAFDGLIAHLAIYNIALSDADVANLALFAPTSVQAGNLVAYYPFTTDQGAVTYPDSVGTFTLTQTNTSFNADNPVLSGGAGVAGNGAAGRVIFTYFGGDKIAIDTNAVAGTSKRNGFAANAAGALYGTTTLAGTDDYAAGVRRSAAGAIVYVNGAATRFSNGNPTDNNGALAVI